MDEPFSSLDERLRDRVRQRNDRPASRHAAPRRSSSPTIRTKRSAVGDRIALLQRGRLLQCGSAERSVRASDNRVRRAVLQRRQRAGRHLPPWARGDAARQLRRAASAGARGRPCLHPAGASAGRVGPDRHSCARGLASEFLGEIDRVTLDVAGLAAPVSLRVFGRARLVPGRSVYLEVESVQRRRRSGRRELSEACN